MNIAILADVHGRLLLAFKLVERYQRETGEQIDLILQACESSIDATIGCRRHTWLLGELQYLFDAAVLASDDQVIAVGDIVDRGLDSPRVLEFFAKETHVSSLMGDNERKHVLSHHWQVRPSLSDIDDTP